MGYTNVEQAIIQPHERYQAWSDCPPRVILCHHRGYLDIWRGLTQKDSRFKVIPWDKERDFRILVSYSGIPMVIDNARDNAEESSTHLVEWFFRCGKKPKTLVNIGSAGGINPDLQIGDRVIGTRAIRDNGSVANLATSDVAAVSDSRVSTRLQEIRGENDHQQTHGDIWSVANMYYTRQRLNQILSEGQYDPQAVETEMGALCITAGWLNENYAQIYGEMSIGNFFYLSDTLPQPGTRWQDTMNDLSLLAPFKRQVLIQTAEAIASLTPER